MLVLLLLCSQLLYGSQAATTQVKPSYPNPLEAYVRTPTPTSSPSTIEQPLDLYGSPARTPTPPITAVATTAAAAMPPAPQTRPAQEAEAKLVEGALAGLAHPSRSAPFTLQIPLNIYEGLSATNVEGRRAILQTIARDIDPSTIELVIDDLCRFKGFVTAFDEQFSPKINLTTVWRNEFARPEFINMCRPVPPAPTKYPSRKRKRE